jgi:hypothetical protein
MSGPSMRPNSLDGFSCDLEMFKRIVLVRTRKSRLQKSRLCGRAEQ